MADPRERMQIAWMTPMARRSAIGRYSIAVVRAISELADVDVFYPATGDDLHCPEARSNVPIEQIGSSEETLAGYDAVFYNFGNYLDYHTEIFDQYVRVPGIPVLHDKVMQGFFVSYITRRNPAYYLRLMHYLYGPSGRTVALRLLPTKWSELESLTSEKYPLFEPCLVNARGVVIHSQGALELVSKRYGELLPAVALDLPTFIYDLEYPCQPLLSRSELDVPDDALLVVVAGRMNPTKRIEATIEAVAGDASIREGAFLVLVGGGEPEYLASVQESVKRSALGRHVRLVLHPDDRLLHSYIAAADVCINLRSPSTESASASLVEQMQFGKPVVVTKTGVYDEVPDEAVVKTTTEDEVASIRAALHRLLSDSGYREAVGAAAREFVRTHNAPEVFAERLLTFVASLPGRAAGLEMVDEAAEEFACVPIDASFDERIDEVARRIARELMPANGTLRR